MSASVDERIVQMQFDNAQFESKAQNTITTLNSLNEALKLPTGNSGMEKIQDTSRKIDFSKLNEAIELVNYRFSNLGIIATNVLNRITNAAIDTGRKMVDALTIRPIKDGFSEYEEKMDSVKRILNSAKDSEGLPVTLDVVNKKLDELNRYSDKTIYSFRDMTQNIGKFTNAGVSLDDSVAAIQGIANEAALSGANANEASRAMYNFAQALSAGYVKLIDWKSIENANMATVGFKEQLLETALAVGTVVKEDGKYITTTTDMHGKISEAFDATHGFNDALSHQWMTSEVLTKTLAKYADETTEVGKAAYQAATEVMTFHKLIDTLKEAMGSGWAQTWQLIIGDYGEAKELWTGINNVLSNMINASADSRNKLIGDWEVLGGRTAVLDGLKEAWAGLVNIAREVEWAFSLVLEKIDGFDLVNISLGIRNFGKEFRSFTGRHGSEINGIAQGIASAFDLMAQTFSAIGRTVEPLLQPLGNLFGLILHNSGIAGRSFTEFVKSLRDNDTIYKGLQNVIATLQKVYDFAGRAVSAVLKLFGIDTGFDSSINPIQALVNVLSGIGENPYVLKAASVIDAVRDAITTFVSNVQNSAGLQNATGILEKIGNVLSSIGKVLGGGVLYLLDSAGRVIRDMFGSLKNASLDNLLNIFTAGSAAGVALGLRKLFKSLADPIESFNGFFDFLKNIGDTADKVGEALGKFADKITGPFKAMQESIKADIIMKIAKTIAILVASIFVMSTIDPGRLTMAVFGIAGLMAELAGMLNALSTLISDSDAAKLKSLGPTMALLSVAIGILTLSAKALGEMDPGQLLSGVVAVGFLVIIMTRMKEIGNDEINTKGLISMSVAIGILALVTRFLGGMDPGQLLNGVLAVGALVIIMLRIQELANKQINPKGLISMSIAIGILGVIAKLLGSVEPDELITGILAVGTLMELMNRLASANQNINIKGFLSLSLAVGVLALAAKMLGKMDPDRLISGVLAVSALMEVMGHVASNAKGDLKTAASIAIMAVAMNALIPVVTLLGALPFEKVAQGVASLAVVLGILIVAGGAAQGIVVPLLGLAGAITLIGVGVAALGAGLLMASIAITAFGVSMVASGASIVATIGVIIAGVIGLIPLIATAIVQGILQILRLIGDSAQTIVDVVVQVGLAVINGLQQLLVPLGTFIMEAFIFILQLLNTYMPIITNAVVELVINLIDGVSMAIYNNTDRIMLAVRHLVGAIIDFVLASLQELLRGIPGVGGKIESEIGKLRESVRTEMGMNQGMTDGSAYPQGLANGAESQTGLLESSGSSLGETFKGGLTSALSTLSPELKDTLASNISGGISETIPEAELQSEGLGTDMIAAFDTGLFNGLGDVDESASMIPDVAASAMGNGAEDFLQNGSDMTSAFANGLLSDPKQVQYSAVELGETAFGALNEQDQEFADAGENNSDQYITGIDSNNDDAKYAGDVLGNSAVSGLNGVTGFYEAGRDSSDGYINGLLSRTNDIADAAASVVANALESARDAIDSHSPSRKYYALGEDSGEGYILGAKSKSTAINDTLSTLALDAMDAFYVGISRANMAANTDIVVTPKISPVMDMNHMYGDLDYLGSLFNGAGGVLGSIVTDVNGNVEDIAELKATASEILEALKRARPITIDGETVIGWVDRGLGAYI